MVARAGVDTCRKKNTLPLPGKEPSLHGCLVCPVTM